VFRHPATHIHKLNEPLGFPQAIELIPGWLLHHQLLVDLIFANGDFVWGSFRSDLCCG
jgi:hypothetical protein